MMPPANPLPVDYTGKEPPMDPPYKWLSGQPLPNDMLTEGKDLVKSKEYEDIRRVFSRLHKNGYEPLTVNRYVKQQLGVPLISPAMQARISQEFASAMVNILNGSRNSIAQQQAVGQGGSGSDSARIFGALGAAFLR